MFLCQGWRTPYISYQRMLVNQNTMCVNSCNYMKKELRIKIILRKVFFTDFARYIIIIRFLVLRKHFYNVSCKFSYQVCFIIIIITGNIYFVSIKLKAYNIIMLTLI